MKRLNLKLPHFWADLTQKNLLTLGKLLLSNMSKEQILVQAFLKFSGLKPVYNFVKIEKAQDYNAQTIDPDLMPYKFKGQTHYISAEDFAYWCKKIDWLLEPHQTTPNLKRIAGRKGCHPLLYNVSLRQMLFADMCYNQYIGTHDEMFLAMLTATFYRFPWQRYKSKKVQRRSKAFRKRRAEMQVVMMWYGGTKLMLKSKFPHLYKQSDDDEPLTTDKIYLSTLSALNGGDITKNEKILDHPAIEAYSQLHQQAVAVYKARQQSKKK